MRFSQNSSGRGLCAVCVVHKLASGWHPIAPAAHSRSSSLTLPAFSSWVPMATPVGPYHSSLSHARSLSLSLYPPRLFLSQAALVSFHSQTLPYISAEQSRALHELSALYVCHCACLCLSVGGHGKFRLMKTDYFRVPPSQSTQPKISPVFSKGQECNV